MPITIKKSFLITLTIVVSVFFLVTPFTVYAEEGEEIDTEMTNKDDDDGEDMSNKQENKLLQIYEDLDDILVLDKGIWYQDLLRSAGKYLMLLLSKIVDFLENGVDTLLGQNHFYEQSGVKKLMDQLAPYAFGLFLISLIFIGFQFIWNKIDNRAELVMNIVLAVSVIILVPKMFSMLDDVLQWGLDGVSGKHSLSEEVIKMNVADLQLYVERDFKYAGKETNNYAGDKKTLPRPTSRNDLGVGTTDFTNGNKLKGTNISVNEKLDIQADEGWFPWTTEEWVKDLKKNNNQAYKFLKYKAVPKSDGSSLKLKELAKNSVPGTKIGQEAYFRYKLNWGTIFATLAILGFVLAITVVKVARVMYELAFHGIAVMFVASTDLNGGQRIKKMITEIVSSFAVLFVMVLILKLYTYFTSWALDMKSDIGWIPYILVMIAGAWAVIDAPDIVTRILGIDAGLRSGWQAMTGAYAGARMAGGGTKGIGSMIGGAGSAVASGKGLIDGLRGKDIAQNNKGSSKMSASNGSPNRSSGSIAGKNNSDEQQNQSGSSSENSTIPSKQSELQEGQESRNERNIENKANSLNNEKNEIPSNAENMTQNINQQNMRHSGNIVRNDGDSIPSSDNENISANISNNRAQNHTDQNIPSKSESGLIDNVDDKRNPYNKEQGIFGGSRGSQRRRDAKARGYNTGLRIRNKFKKIDDEENDK